jgi:hypothetical protein
VRELAATTLTHRGAGDFEANRRAFAGTRRKAVDQRLFAVSEPRRAAAAPRSARHQHCVLDKADGEFPGPLDPSRRDTIALKSDRAIFTDPFFN